MCAKQLLEGAATAATTTAILASLSTAGRRGRRSTQRAAQHARARTSLAVGGAEAAGLEVVILIL